MCGTETASEAAGVTIAHVIITATMLHRHTQIDLLVPAGVNMSNSIRYATARYNRSR